MAKRAEIAFREEVARVFLEAIKIRKLTISAAALQLGVSRQSMHKYLRASTTPRSSLITKACIKWGLSMNVYGKTFTAAAFETPKGVRLSQPIQLSFTDVLKSLRDRNLEIKLLRAEGAALEFKVRIEFAS
jgi:hypothetical protein